MTSASRAVASRSVLAALNGARRLLELDEAVHDAFFDLIDAARSLIFASLARRRVRTVHARAAIISGRAPHEAVNSPEGCLSAPIATPARVLNATSARRNAARRSRHLDCRTDSAASISLLTADAHGTFIQVTYRTL
eukprot:190438-Pleurochrysis_carterae.AAC.3